MPSGGRLILHQNVTFQSALINGVALTPGTHSYASLNTNFGTQIEEGGSGSITVQALPTPDLDLTGYTLSFADEFDGPLSVSNWGWGTKWIAHKPDGGDFGHGAFTYAPPSYIPYTVSNGILSMKAWFSTVDNKWHAANLSALAQGGYGFAQRYGYFEARMKFADKPYAFPSFWLLSTGAFEIPPIRTAELDAVEYKGNSPTTAQTTTHRWNFGTKNEIAQFTTVAGMTTDFHTYGVLVKPESITYFIDGKRIYQVPNYPEAQTPLFPLVTYALQSTPPASEQSVVSVTEVDYVRVYEAPPSITGLIPRGTYAINGVDSQDGANTGAKAIDGDYMTHWLSAPGAAKPHEIKIDLGSPKTVAGLTYLPRQSTGTLDGLIRDYEVRVSADGTNWTLVDYGSWYSSPLEKASTFTEMSGIRYVSLKDVGTNGTLTSAAEINILSDNSDFLPGSMHIFEAEEVSTVTATDSVEVFVDDTASAGKFERFNANAVNDSVTYTVPVLADTYAVMMRYKTYSGRGQIQLSIDGVDQGPVVDQYNASTKWIEVDLGTKEFATSGNKEFKFTVVGKNASSSAYGITVDYIRLVTAGEEPGPTPINLAPSGTISAYSSYSSGYGPTKAIDGIDTVSTNWWRGSSAVYPQWIEINLGSNRVISGTELVGYDNRAYRFQVEAKPNGGTYQTVLDNTANTQASPIANSFTPVTAQYVKVTVTGAYNYAGNWTTLHEFKVFGN